MLRVPLPASAMTRVGCGGSVNGLWRPGGRTSCAAVARTSSETVDTGPPSTVGHTQTHMFIFSLLTTFCSTVCKKAWIACIVRLYHVALFFCPQLLCGCSVVTSRVGREMFAGEKRKHRQLMSKSSLLTLALGPL